ncbi:ankyrin repeat-containing domain protein [Phaeosphaeriaceae sp. PMI808]|nr:ankyrin repeat-containing domain protein [Phaeosphaeriaceae sp. PMI808]
MEVKFLRCLNTLPYRDRKDRNPDRVPGTCDWFVSHELFQDWKESKSSRMLWVSADPGCGKSVLAKYLVNSVLPTTESRTVCYFFFKDIEDQRSVVGALCCILRQLFWQKPILLSNAILKQFEVDGENFTSSINEVWDTLINAAEDGNAGEIICLLDAIDECESEGRSQLTQKLCQLYGTRRNSNLKFLLTSRPYSEIRRDFQPLKIPTLPVIHLSGEGDVEMEKISREINVFIKARVQDIGKQLELSYHEQKLLLERLLCVPNRTYLWVHLTLDLIQNEIHIDKAKIREATSHLPKTVDEAYSRILSKSRYHDKARKILHIIVAAARPLTLREMSLALVLQESHRSYGDVELELEPEERFHQKVRDICGLFVTIINSRLYLLHQTAKEFLVPNNTANPPEGIHMDLKWKHSLQPQESHRILTEICMWYLLFEDFKNSPLGENVSLSQYVEDHTFLDYSAKHWAAHFRELQIEVQGAMTQSILIICDMSSRRCLTWFRIYWTSTNTDFPQGFTNLMLVSYFGLSTAVKYLLKVGGIDLNSQDDTYQRSALSWAAGRGYDVAVKLLINDANIGRRVFNLLSGRRARINSVDKYGRTSLSYAVWSGNVAVVKLLVKAGARANSKDEIGGTPLSYAVCNGYKEVIELLLKGDTQADLEDISKELLLSAARKGHEDVVRLLLDTGKIDLDVRDDDGQAPLSWAAKNGHGAIVNLLLATGKVDINVMDRDNWTPLSWAIEKSDKDMVELFLKAGARVDYTYVVYRVSEPALSLVYTSVELIANPSVSGYYSIV